MISPAYGKIIYIIEFKKDTTDYLCISIYLDFFDNHTQCYPINGTVVERHYDLTGKFKLVAKRIVAMTTKNA